MGILQIEDVSFIEQEVSYIMNSQFFIRIFDFIVQQEVSRPIRTFYKNPKTIIDSLNVKPGVQVLGTYVPIY